MGFIPCRWISALCGISFVKQFTARDAQAPDEQIGRVCAAAEDGVENKTACAREAHAVLIIAGFGRGDSGGGLRYLPVDRF